MLLVIHGMNDPEADFEVHLALAPHKTHQIDKTLCFGLTIFFQRSKLKCSESFTWISSQ